MIKLAKIAHGRDSEWVEFAKTTGDRERVPAGVTQSSKDRYNESGN